MAKTRSSNATRQATRARSWKRTQERKEARRKEIAEAEARNRKLRAEGKKTPHEIHQDAQHEKMRARYAARIAAGLPGEQARNERGFIVETSKNGHTTLRDPGNWNKRRNARHRAIADGTTTVIVGQKEVPLPSKTSRKKPNA